MGHTGNLTNRDIRKIKPEWAYAATVLVNSVKPIDAPTDRDRALIVEVTNEIRKELKRLGYDMTNADIQATLWYLEKDIWAKLARKPESNPKQSYDKEFEAIAKERGFEKEALAALAKVNAEIDRNKTATEGTARNREPAERGPEASVYPETG